MNWVTMDPRHPSPPRRPSFRLPPPPAPHGSSLRNRVSPSFLLIILVLAIIFFVCGLLHLLVRFIMRRRNGGMDELGVGTAFQGQLQQLFHLHDSGVDQFFIDSLPLFQYNAIIGLKKPFDCAICLCEFKEEDKLRLLPKCSHAFHMECIDTWLLSHSTCPLCRTNLLPDLSPNSSCSPSVMVLESGSENSREVVGNGEVGRPPDAEPGSARIDKPGEVSADAEGPPGEKVLSVKLGKFKNVDGGEGSSTTTTPTATTVNINTTTSSNPRRCFSMDSFGYVMDETAYLQVPIRTTIMKQSIQSRKLAALPLKPGQRVASSECDCQSMRYLSGLEAIKSKGEGSIQSQNANSGNGDSSVGRGIVRKKESFSISKTWLMGRRGEKPNASEDASSRRGFSFRFPVTRGGDPEAGNDIGEVNRASCEVEIGSEMDEDARSCNSLDYSQASSSYGAPPSLTRRTLLWLMGRRAQNKVGHSSSSSVDQV